MSERSLRPTWALLWTFLALLLSLTTVGFIGAIALSGADRGEIAFAVLLIGIPAVLGVFALGTLALVMARPSGARWKAVRRWGLALLGSVALLTGVVTVKEDADGAVLLLVAGASAMAFLALDLRRGRGGE